MDPKDYCQPLHVLSLSTIGQHYRHCIEFFDCLYGGLESGVVSYDKRKREERLNVDTDYTLERIEQLIQLIRNTVDQELELEVCYPCSEIAPERIKSSVLRELHYNIEHLVHHMAIIKIGVIQNFPEVALNPSFGVSESTIAYQEAQ